MIYLITITTFYAKIYFAKNIINTDFIINTSLLSSFHCLNYNKRIFFCNFWKF